MIRPVINLSVQKLATEPERGKLCLARVGAVSYLNSKPLIEGLDQILPNDHFRLDYPARLADDLYQQRLDVALIPSVEYFSHADYVILSDACVATRGPVLSVKLFSRKPLAEIRSLALDVGSRTSAALTRLMLWERFGVNPELYSLPIEHSLNQSSCDAILLIGDRAIHTPAETFVETWDLGEEWVNWTGLPFVFAMWVGRSHTADAGLENILCNARDRGLERLPEIARREAPLLGLSEKTALHYLQKNLHFQLGAAERQGLELFQELLQKMNDAQPITQRDDPSRTAFSVEKTVIQRVPAIK